MKPQLISFSDVVVNGLMSVAFAVIAALIHYSGIMRQGSALFWPYR
jgi:hypothetical protein